MGHHYCMVLVTKCLTLPTCIWHIGFLGAGFHMCYSSLFIFGDLSRAMWTKLYMRRLFATRNNNCEHLTFSIKWTPPVTLSVIILSQCYFNEINFNTVAALKENNLFVTWWMPQEWMCAGNSEALPGRFGTVFLQKELETWFGSENDCFRLLPITTHPGRNPIYSKNHSAAC